MSCLNLKKFLGHIFVLYFLIGCGYQPILDKKNQNFSIISYNLEGNKRLGGLLKNNLITTKNENNVLILNIKSKKKSSTADKSQTGKIITYKLNLEFEITANDKNDNIVFSKVYARVKNYSAAEVHMDTLNNEKKLLESLIETVANELQIDLNSIYQK